MGVGSVDMDFGLPDEVDYTVATEFNGALAAFNHDRFHCFIPHYQLSTS
jgi:hypothetical protein